MTLFCILGSTVSLECNADGYPRPVIKWRREKGEKIKILGKNGRMKKVDRFIGSKLTIHDVETKDMGSYLCMADNGVPPIVSKRIFLYVQCNIKKILRNLKKIFTFFCIFFFSCSRGVYQRCYRCSRRWSCHLEM